MQKLRTYHLLLGCLLILLMLTGCLGKVKKTEINYYVLDYQASSENQQLRRPQNNGKVLEVLNTTLPKTYDRNQIVVKENFYRVRFLQNDVWANKLRDAIPNLIAQRLRAYNIFGNVSRGAQTDKVPSYFLETTVFNIEKLEGSDPMAYLRIEFVLRDSTDTRILFTHRGERKTDLIDPSMVFLVQAFNDMLMEETNIFASKCNQYFSGKLAPERSAAPVISNIDKFHYESMENPSDKFNWGELMVITKTATEEQIRYTVEKLDSLNNVVETLEGEAATALLLPAGRYNVTLGEFGESQIPVTIKARQRSVVKPNWGELQVIILDPNQNRVRQGYDIWKKNTDSYGYSIYSGGMFSMGEDEVGAVDKLWIIPPNQYMIKVGGGHWSDLRNFVTVPLDAGERKTLTIVINPQSETDHLMVGAGVLSDEDLGLTSKRWHRGIVYGKFKLLAKNDVDKDKPDIQATIEGTFDNNIDIHDGIRPFHFTTRSIYDLGVTWSNTKNLNFSKDDYSLRSVLLLYPMEKKKFFKNFAFYGRANLNTHFFDQTTIFDKDENYILWDYTGREVEKRLKQPSFRSKIAFYPLRLREGGGITYRFNFGANSWSSLRVGYGLQQDYNNKSYVYSDTLNTHHNDNDNIIYHYKLYREEENRSSKGIESTLILSVANLFKFFSINSTVDVLFPMGLDKLTYSLENENRLNIRIYRSVSLDLVIKMFKDDQVKKWLVYDYDAGLRVALYY